MKIIGAIFEKIYILLFRLCELLLILGVGEKLKKMDRDIFMRTLDIEFKRDRRIGSGSTFGDGHTDTHTDFFLKHFFRIWG